MRWRDPQTCFVGGLVLLGLSWTVANPPFAAPDERDHFIRAVGIAEGELIGRPAPAAKMGGSLEELRYDQQTQRAVVVPARLNPVPYDCYVRNPELSAHCLDRDPAAGPPVRLITTVGTYPPLPLMAPAAALRGADEAPDAVYRGRLIVLVINLMLLLGAVSVLYERSGGGLSLAGLAAACTPTALFLMASLSPSGFSISTGIALCACLVRLGRRPENRRRTWWLLGISAALLALSHPTGLAWTGLLVAGFVAAKGVGTSWRLVRDDARTAWPGLSLLVLGAGVALLWKLNYGPSTAIDTRSLGSALTQAPGNYWDFTRQLVGVFGYLEFRLPRVVYAAWFCSIAALAVAAVWAGSRREKKLIATAGALAIVGPIGAWALFGRAIGNGMAGRIFLPVMVGFPMLCGDIVYRNRERLRGRSRSAVALSVSLTGVVQFVAWYINGRRSAVGIHGPLLYPLHAQWTPPLGWSPWLGCAAVGALLLISVPVHRTRWRGDRANARPGRDAVTAVGV